MTNYLTISPLATKTRLERELAEAVRDEGDNRPGDVARNPSGSGEGEEVGSDSDSDCGGVAGGGGVGMLQHSGSLEASMWSLDISATSSLLETSTYETEVSCTCHLCKQ